MCVAGNLTLGATGGSDATPALHTDRVPGGNRKRLSFFFWRPINITTTKVLNPKGNIYNNHIIWGGSRMVAKNSSPGQEEGGRGITVPVPSSPGNPLYCNSIGSPVDRSDMEGSSPLQLCPSHNAHRLDGSVECGE